MLAHSTAALATFLYGLMQKRCYWERVARETFPAAPHGTRTSLGILSRFLRDISTATLLKVFPDPILRGLSSAAGTAAAPLPQPGDGRA